MFATSICRDPGCLAKRCTKDSPSSVGSHKWRVASTNAWRGKDDSQLRSTAQSDHQTTSESLHRISKRAELSFDSRAANDRVRRADPPRRGYPFFEAALALLPPGQLPINELDAFIRSSIPTIPPPRTWGMGAGFDRAHGVGDPAGPADTSATP